MSRRRNGFVSGATALLLAGLSVVAVGMVRAGVGELKAATRAAERLQDLYLLRGALAEQAFQALETPVRDRGVRLADGRNARLLVEQESGKLRIEEATAGALRGAFAGLPNATILSEAIIARRAEEGLPHTLPELAGMLEAGGAGLCALARLRVANSPGAEQPEPDIAAPWPVGEAFTLQLWLDGRSLGGLAHTYARDEEGVRLLYERVIRTGETPCR